MPAVPGWILKLEDRGSSSRRSRCTFFPTVARAMGAYLPSRVDGGDRPAES